MKVAKFGGTSLANGSQIRKVVDIILSDPERRLIVVSAPGKRFKDDIKVTDLLIACAEKFIIDGKADEEVGSVVARYREIADDLGMSSDIVEKIEEDLKDRLKSYNGERRLFLDLMKAAGEDNTAKLVAEYIKTLGREARYINPKDAGLLLSSEYGNAHVLPQSFKNLRKLRDESGILIFPGFFGYTVDGNVATFPRGGSDITGSILAAAVKADIYENFTDVDSVFAANPNIVSNPRPISELTYREMRELSYAGFSVLHEETLEPVFRAGIPVCIKNTNNPSSPGTKITVSRTTGSDKVVGIACDKGFCAIYVSKYLMNREIGFGRRLFQILEEEGLSYEHSPSSIDSISVIVRESDLDKVGESKLVDRIIKGLAVDEVSVSRDLALVHIVGEGMRNTIGIAKTATAALADANINIELINQGASEISIIFGVKGADADRAVVALYNAFFK